ncbi:MAG: ADP-ribosylglycohydrolase family protein [Anaerolineae bacterium]
MDITELRQLLRDEITQRREEGCDTSPVEAQAEQLEAASADEMLALYERLMRLEPRPDFRYEEPSDLPTIHALRPAGPRHLAAPWDEQRLLDRILGAYLGRCAGCNLGKPVEGWTRDKIRRYLEAAHAYPLHSYFPVLQPFPEGLALHPNYKETTLGHIKWMARDDDIDYTILGLHYLETYGLDFTTENVGEAWLQLLPYQQVYTAERAAYRNLVEGYAPPHTATRFNPYREWIGAQIRADGFGYVCPGLPEVAADLAYRDATLSHVKNGIYGEMWVAAMLAAALVAPGHTVEDIRWVIEIGLSEIPQNCRLAEAIRDVMRWHQETPHWEETWQRVHDKYGHYHPVHTINNAALVAMALLYGEGELEKTICIAVMGGWDTDCNGATAGSVIGAMLGAEALPYKWVGPLNNLVRSMVAGYDLSQLTNLAERSLAIAREVRDRWG